MKLAILLLSATLLTGCFGTAPIKVHPYPEAPVELLAPADPLKKLAPESNLVDVSKTITYNYSQYHIISERLRLLQDWVQRIRKESLDVNGRTESSQEKIR